MDRKTDLQARRIDASEYHACQAFGSSALRRLLVSPPDFWAIDLAKIKSPTSSEAQLLGIDFHAAIASGEEWRNWAVLPTRIEEDDVFAEINSSIKGTTRPLVVGEELNTSLSAHRQYLARHRQLAEQSKIRVLDGRVASMIAACFDNPAIRELLLLNGHREHEVGFVLDHPSGVAVKALCDLLIGDEIIVDWKTTHRRSNASWLRDAFRKYGYDWQAGLYSLITGRPRFYFVSITNSSPYLANLFEVPQRLLCDRQRQIEKQLDRLAALLRLKDVVTTTADGLPITFCPDGWGTTCQFSELGVFDLIEFVEVDE